MSVSLFIFYKQKQKAPYLDSSFCEFGTLGQLFSGVNVRILSPVKGLFELIHLLCRESSSMTALLLLQGQTGLGIAVGSIHFAASVAVADSTCARHHKSELVNNTHSRNERTKKSSERLHRKLDVLLGSGGNTPRVWAARSLDPLSPPPHVIIISLSHQVSWGPPPRVFYCPVQHH